MKLTMPYDMLKQALERGGLAVFKDKTVDETVREVNPTQSCVKISADGNAITIESSSGAVNAKHTLSSDKINVERGGTVCVDANMLMKDLKTIDNPLAVTMDFDESGADPAAGKPGDSVVPMGDMKFKACFESGTASINKAFTVYHEADFTATSYSDGQSPSFKVKRSALAAVAESVSFACSADQENELFDHVCVFVSEGNLYMAGTDNKRAALHVLPADSHSISDQAANFLIKKDLFDAILSQFGKDEDITFIRDLDDEHLTLSSDTLVARVSMPASNTRKKYPNFIKVINLPTEASVTFANKVEFLQALKNIKAHSPRVEVSMADGDSSVHLVCSNNRKSTADIPCDAVVSGLKGPVSLSSEFLVEAIGALPGQGIKMSFTPDEKKMILNGLDGKMPFYLAQRVIGQD